jgi:simple sugar transport system substrate-binding protein
MRQLVQDGCDWILAGASGYMTVAKQVAAETKVKFNVIFSQENVPDNIQDIQTYAEQGAYLAGVLAAKTTKSGTVGIIVSADDENWTKMSAGFIIAAKATKPDIKIKLAQVGQAAYADAPAAKRTTETVIAEGADVIFGMGDGSSFGMIQACETATPPAGADKVWFIDVIGDKTSLDTKGIYLSSVVWDYLPAWEQAYADIQAGTFGTKTIWLELANNGIGIIKTQWISEALWTEIEGIKQQIIDGTIKVPAIDKMDEVQKLL